MIDRKELVSLVNKKLESISESHEIKSQSYTKEMVALIYYAKGLEAGAEYVLNKKEGELSGELPGQSIREKDSGTEEPKKSKGKLRKSSNDVDDSTPTVLG